MSAGIEVKEFKYIPGVNDAEYIKKLEELCEIDKGIINTAVEKIKKLSAQLAEQPEIIRCQYCIYYDSPHVENNGERIEYNEMPEDAFDVLGTGLVSLEYGINIGGRCLRDYNAGYSEDKRVFVPETNYCGRAERRADETD